MTINSVQQTNTPGVYEISYNSVVRQGYPTTSIYLSKVGRNHSYKDGETYLIDSFPATNGQSTYELDARNLDIDPAMYYVAIDIDDPNSIVAEAVSDQEVVTGNAMAPDPVSNIALAGGNGSFSVSWQPSDSFALANNVDNFLIRYTTNAVPDEFESEMTVGYDMTNAIVTNLVNGQPYLVTVVAVDENGYESPQGEIERVVPSLGYDLDPPVITSTPNVGATAGQTYVYVPETFDADDRQPVVPVVVDASDPPPDSTHEDANGLFWQLVSGPPGMTILDDGIVMWTPDTNQVGDFTVTISATKVYSMGSTPVPGPLVGTQTYTLTVVPSWDLSGLQPNNYAFVSRAPTTAYENQTYSYSPIVMTATTNYTISIVEGPTNMTVAVDGTGVATVNWPVPAGATGQRVRLLAVPDTTNVTTADYVYQEYWLSVVNSQNQMPTPLQITDVTPLPQGVELIWNGVPGVSSYQVQRTQDLVNGPWANVGPRRWRSR